MFPQLYHTDIISGALHALHLISRGRGFEASGIGGTSEALCNTRERLKLLCCQRARLFGKLQEELIRQRSLDNGETDQR